MLSTFDLDVEEIPLPLLSQGGRGGQATSKGLLLIFAHIQGQSFSAGEQGQANRPVRFTKGKDTSVVVNAGGFEDAPPGLGLSQPRGNPCNGTDCEVGRQAEFLPYLFVAGMVQGKLPGDIMLAPVVGYKVAGIGKCLQRRLNMPLVVRQQRQLARDRSDTFHVIEDSECPSLSQPQSTTEELVERRFLRHLKEAVFTPRFI